ncbi:glycosyltransferase [gamma proteobacterium HIMB55]|nr:glycosyltransferase [gamma proteobacterium HIMB55]
MKLFMFVNVDWFFLSHRLDIAKQASANGVDLTVFAEFTSEHVDKAYGDFLFSQSPLKRSRRGGFSLLVEFWEAFKLIKSSKPDLVHAVTIKPIIVLGIICFVLRVPFVASVSGLGPVFSTNGTAARIRRRIVMLVYWTIFYPEKVRVICQSSHDADTLTDSGVCDRSKVVMTQGSGVDISKYAKNRRAKSNKHKVLMASRLLGDKGVREYCMAAGAIAREGTIDVDFCLAGPIDEHSPGALSEPQVIELCGSNQVTLLGNRKDLDEILAGTDIFVLPSYYAEGMPKVLLEAAASGCAVVTTDHPGCRDAILPDITGLLVAPRDADKLADAVMQLLNDRDSILSMGKAGRKLAEERFSIERVIDTHYSIYRSLSGTLVGA